MKRAYSVLALGLFACSSTVGPTSSEPKLEEAKSSLSRNTSPSVPTADQTHYVSDNTAFAVDLYKRLVVDSKNNEWFSPHSVTTALGMTYAGAVNQTATEMATALHFALPNERLHPAANWLDLELAKRGQKGADQNGQPLKLRSVNSLFAERTAKWKQPFLDTLGVNYGAPVNLMDFIGAADTSRKAINDWVSYKTEAKIQELIPSGRIDGSTRLVLVNAVYFNAGWLTPFEAAQTRDEDFFTQGAEVPTKVPTMHGSTSGSYASLEDADIAEIPYSGNETSMVIVMPKTAFSTWESQLTAASFSSAISSLKPSDLDLSLPKFQIKGKTLSLMPHLKALGMKQAFSAAADFSAMSDMSLYVSDVLHQAFVDVNEKGTEAAAATAVIANETSAREAFKVTVNRPFVVAIRDRVTGAILFLGRVVNPVGPQGT